MTDNIFVFDRKILRAKRTRAASHLKEHGFLFDWTSKQIIERLEVIKKKFPLVLQIGARSGLNNHQDFNGKFGIETLFTLDNTQSLSPSIIADEELSPFKNDVFDLVFSPLNLHTTNDLPGTLVQIRHSLKEDGLFIGALLGGETLYELRYAMNQAEIDIYGGQSPRVAPFADLPQMGALMQRAGFNLPVIDSEKITVTYDNTFKLMQDLRLMGESNIMLQRRKNFTPRQFFQKVEEIYKDKYAENDGRITSTFEIIFMLGWKPHDSQQKPLKPGSAKNRLSDALATTEEDLPC